MGSAQDSWCRCGKQEIADRIERVSTEEATEMQLRLSRKEGLFAGTSTGANVVVAIRMAGEFASGATIVTVICDTGMKYLKNLAGR
jgi:cysteine synthase